MAANQLQSSVSAYLRQHAQQPVAWRVWGSDALDEADRLNRPLFLSIGYAACHWCHVMAHESFDDPAIASFLNEHFVPVKIDREEHPDVDAAYMAATQAVSGSGGWPMSVFALPNGRPFMAGIYYPPEDRHGQPGFMRLLHAMHDAWQSQRPIVVEQADAIHAAVQSEQQVLDRLQPARTDRRGWSLAGHLADEVMRRVDVDGGFSPAPKFPRPSFLQALFTHCDQPDVRDAMRDTLDAMSRRGLFDHVDGGFARYSVDAEWHIPHFEKMLSDQALLASCYFEADRALGGQTPYRVVALRTLSFCDARLRTDLGYASSLDADTTEGEGAHITWTRAEVDLVLTEAHLETFIDAVCARYRIDDAGFEGRAIPRLAGGATFACPPSLEPAIEALRRARDTRPQPTLDDKVVAEWNAMLAIAQFDSRDEYWTSRALDLVASMWQTHRRAGRTIRTPQGLPAIATDVAWLGQAFLAAYRATGSDEWLDRAEILGDELITYFGDRGPDGELVGIFASAHDTTSTFVRVQDVFDGATPSSAAVALSFLGRLATITETSRWIAASDALRQRVDTLVSEHPFSAPDLALAAISWDLRRTVVVPGSLDAFQDVLHSSFVPHAVIVTGTGRSPLLRDRPAGSAYVCENATCALPATSAAMLAAQVSDRASWR